MKTVLRSLAIVFGLILLVVGLGAAYLALVFDPNTYRDRLAAEVERQTGRELVIGGDIGLSLFPWLGVELAEVSLGDAPGFGDTPFVRVGQVQARARILPLLRGEVDVDRVVLEGLELKLARDAEGRPNWADLVSDTSEDDTHRRGRDGLAAGAGVFAIGGVEVRSARLIWEDAQAGVRHELSGLDLVTDAIRPGVPFDTALGFDLALDEPALRGRFDLAGRLTVWPDRERLQVAGLDIRFDGAGDSLPGGRKQLALRSDVALDLASDSLALSGLVLEVLGLRLEGSLNGKDLSANPSVSGRLSAPRFDPKAVIRALGEAAPVTSDASALTSAGLSLALEASSQSLMLHDIDLQLDDSRLRGEAGLVDLSKQSVRFDLALDAIDLDRYLPPDAPEGAATPGAAAGAAASGAAPEALRALDMQGRLRIGRLVASGLTVSEIEINTRAEGGLIRLAPMSAALYGGRYAGNVQLDARRTPLRITMDESLSGVQIGSLLRDLTGAEERLTGRGDLRARLQADGTTEQEVRRTLNGNAEFRFSDGAVKGVNVAQYLREAAARLRGQPVPAESGPNQTDFTELSGTVRIASGVARNDDLAMRSPLLRVSGDGSANLVSEQIDYRIRASLVGSLEGQGGADRDALRGVTVPIRVGGSFDRPTYALDVETLIAENLSARARERIEERVLERAPQELQQELRRGLRGLLR
ncbi:AsmA family protein [Azoarcus taiwanensis]|uniref:AsmA family protein n=1 Tax=Azoarcus taiwanensis TaxID=666964 RepID=A0A972F8L1_9RHOO|nr:AsmA family protein [Azoarcus taiwanensis]NMG03972.1 AsmA family protein [Azoarcus taiwanensis]